MGSIVASLKADPWVNLGLLLAVSLVVAAPCLGWLAGRRRPYVGGVFRTNTLLAVIVVCFGMVWGLAVALFVGIVAWVALLPVVAAVACVFARLRGD